MATNYWFGGSQSISQVDTRTIAAVSVGSTFTVTINGKAVSVTATTTVAADAAALLLTALTSSTEPEFQEIAWANPSGGIITGTGPTDGTPFTAAYAAGGSGTPTFAGSTTTAASGPNHWDTAANWSLGAIPVGTNDVVIDNGGIDILYGLAQGGVTLASLAVGPGYTGSIGLPERNQKGYQEYRVTHLQIIPTVLNVNSPSGRIKVDLGSTAATVNVVQTGQSNDGEPAALCLKGTSTSNVVNVAGGSVGLASLPGEAFAAATLRVGAGAAGRSPTVVGGTGLTLTTLVQDGGAVTLAAGVTTVTKTDGTLTIYGSGAVTTLTNWGGTLDYQSSGTITTLTVGNGGVADFRSDPRSRTVTNCTLYRGSTLYDNYHTLTLSNPISLPDSDLPDVNLNIGIGRTVAVA